MNVVLLVVVGVLCIGGALFVLTSALAMLRARDGLSRINVLSGATGMGIPWMVTGVYVHHVWTHGFDVVDLIKLLVAIAGFIIMSSVASNALGRAAYRSGAPLDPATEPNDLA
ncbi:cation:proton antiporter [Serinicoccus sp. CNJ-927]|uniref:cation:proton antiporter n=1 Tax=Serinicoccus TaxID=265976 RepID=UPI0003B5FA14|nr:MULTISPECIES: monovalent cation/H(+) antiporter subunit G [Serinicoccus]OLT18108.1 cation:proton antiporter [Serinicoccus sp. CUA-874]OLT44815.1 cation:proton antiporter [Serinicoccus sp. CNJ-927]